MARNAHSAQLAGVDLCGQNQAIDITRTHPRVIIGGLLRENPFFVTPDQFLEEMRQRRARNTEA
jgi:hypothetical protein